MARIMIVDDSAFMRMMIRSILVEVGHEVVAEAADGMEAVQKYDHCQPDLVTMDITMRQMNGIEAVREIIERHPEARIIMCTAMGQQSLLMDALAAGAKGFVIKPFTKAKVLEEVQKLLIGDVTTQGKRT